MARPSKALDAPILEEFVVGGTEAGGGRGAEQSQDGLRSPCTGHVDAAIGPQKCFKREGQAMLALDNSALSSAFC